MSSNSNPKHDENTQITESKELKGSSVVIQLLVIQMWFMDLRHWCYGNANYPATCAPIESEPAFKPGLTWFVWYMKGWKALIYSKVSCMLHFGSLVDWTEVPDKKIFICILCDSEVWTHAFLIPLYSAASGLHPTLQHRGDRDHHCDYLDACPKDWF